MTSSFVGSCSLLDRCTVCGEETSFAHDVLLYCDGCNMALHQRCSGTWKVALHSSVPWFCDICSFMHSTHPELFPSIGVERIPFPSSELSSLSLSKTDSSESPHHTLTRDQLHEASSKAASLSLTTKQKEERLSNYRPACYLCKTNTCAGYKRVVSPDGVDQGLWAHLTCALVFPEVIIKMNHIPHEAKLDQMEATAKTASDWHQFNQLAIAISHEMSRSPAFVKWNEPIVVEKLPAVFLHHECQICHRGGNCIRCCHPKCTQYYHPVCALASRLILFNEGEVQSGPLCNQTFMYCFDHSDHPTLTEPRPVESPNLAPLSVSTSSSPFSSSSCSSSSCSSSSCSSSTAATPVASFTRVPFSSSSQCSLSSLSSTSSDSNLLVTHPVESSSVSASTVVLDRELFTYRNNQLVRVKLKL